MFEALEKERNDRVNAEAATETKKPNTPSAADGLLEVESSEESESEDDFEFIKV